MKRLLGLVMLLVGLVCIGTIIRADEIKIERMEEAMGDISASTHQRKDLNGNVCALVKVELPLRGALFEGNVVGDTEFRGGEYWVYMTPGSKMLKVKHDDLKPVMVNFSDYGIPALDSKTTYTLVLTPPNVGYNMGDGANGSYLVLDITPRTGVVVEVDGELVNVEEGKATTFLQYGNHEFTVKAKGYETYTGTAKIEKGMNTTIPVKLESNMATLTVKPETSGAITKINGTQIGTGTFTESIAPGTYLVEVENPGYTSWSETITISQRENKTLNVPALRPIYGSLNIDFKPVGATVSIDGKEVGTTPAMIGDLLIGNHSVTVSQEGYTPFTTTITISEAETANLSGTLTETDLTEVTTQQSPVDEVELFRESKNGKHGFVDKNGKEVIPFKYDWAGEFSDGLAEVRINWKYGFIDKTGKEVIPIKYSYIWEVSEGIFMAKLDGKYGYVDKNGKEITPFKYERAYNFSDGMALVTWNAKNVYIDKTGKEVIPVARYDLSYDFSDGMAKVGFNDKYGYIDKTGKEVIPLIYDKAGDFSDGMAPVEFKRKWGYIDKTGKEVIPFKYNDAKEFSEGLAAVMFKGKYGFIDKTGKEVIPFKYNDAKEFSEGLAAVMFKGKWGFIDKTGKEVIPFIYDRPDYSPINDSYSFENGKIKVMLNGRDFYIDKNGNEVIK